MPGELIHQHDKDLEATFLGACLNWPDHLDEDWSYLPAEAFYVEHHRRFWREMRRQHDAGGGFDITTIAAAFRERGEYDEFHKAYLQIAGVGLSDYHPCSLYAPHYARRLTRFHVMRERAHTIRRYEAAIARNPDDQDARTELEMVLHVLDGMLNGDTDRSDEQLAREMGNEGRYPTGFTDIDSITGGLARPGLNVVAARPSVGKSAFARSVIRRAAARGDQVLWYSQDQAAGQIFEMEMARDARQSSAFIRSLSRERRIAGINHVRDNVWHGNVTLIDRPLPLSQIVSLTKSTVPDLLVIDYLQILNTGHDTDVERITAASIALKTLASQVRIPILVLAQFNRGHETGKPSMNNLKGSGQIEQDADQIYALERDTTLNSASAQEAQIHVLKNKTGATGMARLHWHGQFASYEPATARPVPPDWREAS